ncbi:MAG: four helix bundle protein [Candidatus Acidiferrales bacterium]
MEPRSLCNSSLTEGSLAELETQALLSTELQFAKTEDVMPVLDEIDQLQKMLIALKRKLAAPSSLATRHSSLVT